ncbi:ribokinase [Algicella marina]|uniref:Ribokinase n=1 Tax=Algicella marina TaxID=2683284 RepID=A0A6P1SXY1_9RHOB|nr:ribokinase [Algicella marina]QHQ34341.1 ribokinase [Algicella marina]
MSRIVVLGVFAADAIYRGSRLPAMGETVLGSAFALGPGGKGSNQAVAAGKLGADVSLITRLGKDAFAKIAYDTWADAGVTPVVVEDPEAYTGSAFIFVDDRSGENAIIICPGAAGDLGPEDILRAEELVRGADVFLAQLEQPLAAALAGVRIAADSGVTTILNPAPAQRLPANLLRDLTYITPNESEAEALTGVAVHDLATARQAGDALLALGVSAAVITLGAEGALLHSAERSEHVPGVSAGPVVDTTGAGDAFNGAFAVALSEGAEPVEAARFACAAAGLSVTRKGAATSSPRRTEVDALLAG